LGKNLKYNKFFYSADNEIFTLYLLTYRYFTLIFIITLFLLLWLKLFIILVKRWKITSEMTQSNQYLLKIQTRKTILYVIVYFFHLIIYFPCFLFDVTSSIMICSLFFLDLFFFRYHHRFQNILADAFTNQEMYRLLLLKKNKIRNIIDSKNHSIVFFDVF